MPGEQLSRRERTTWMIISCGSRFTRQDFSGASPGQSNSRLAGPAGRSREEDWLLSAQSDTEAYFGRRAQAREFSQRAIESALHAEAKETAALWQINAALRAAEFGNAGSARNDAMAALALVPGRDIRSVAALSLARAGDAAEAKKLA